ncbi:hypothetical protein QYE76_034899 [Lolium multiflorum]|uniref:CCHC-type domain-containing protein n=1 Tax=Lolium multiflorum TaxID=4521 RepID=A0AAD8VMY6_LOLMU|nr:hypothetical protein QYE76_034899 [Lolium multiflorum]
MLWSMELQPHPEMRHHAEHLDFMLYHTQKELDNSRAYANQTHLALATHADAIKMLSKDRNKLRLQRAKRDATIVRLRAQIASSEATVKAHEDQLREMEEGEEMAPPNRTNNDAMMQLLQTLLADRETKRAERQANIAALQNLANQGHGNHDHPGSKLKNFQNTNPPVFSKTKESLDADDWIQTMENNLEVAGVEAKEKVLFATHYLAGPARAWWTSTRAMNGGQVMTWADFKLKFSKYHVPPGLIKKMRDEFRELKQGRMTVVEYRDRVGPAIVSQLKRRFCPETTSLGWTSRVSGWVEETRQEATTTTTTTTRATPTTSTAPRAPNTNTNNTNTAPRTGSNAIPVATKDKTTITCYECGVVGHYSNECPKRLAKLAGNTTAPAQQQRRVSPARSSPQQPQ